MSWNLPLQLSKLVPNPYNQDMNFLQNVDISGNLKVYGNIDVSNVVVNLDLEDVLVNGNNANGENMIGLNNIDLSGILSAGAGVFRGQITGLPLTAGVYIGRNIPSSNYRVELSDTNGGSLDFTDIGTDFKGRIQYTNSTNQFDFYTNNNISSVLTLDSLGNVNINNNLLINGLPYQDYYVDIFLASQATIGLPVVANWNPTVPTFWTLVENTAGIVSPDKFDISLNNLYNEVIDFSILLWNDNNGATRASGVCLYFYDASGNVDLPATVWTTGIHRLDDGWNHRLLKKLPKGHNYTNFKVAWNGESSDIKWSGTVNGRTTFYTLNIHRYM